MNNGIEGKVILITVPIRPMSEVNTDEWDAMIDVEYRRCAPALSP